MITLDNLADAIYQAEGGTNTRHPYGVLKHYIHTTPRQACLNTINSNMARYHVHSIDRHFIVLLADVYCPLSADPVGNRNWKHNVIQILHL
jgi:hypothetical protein